MEVLWLFFIISKHGKEKINELNKAHSNIIIILYLKMLKFKSVILD